jgi:radical SAM protein with 4Fe4S-binding SPASM domain
VPGSFARALEGLRTARAAGLNTGIRFTVNKDNYNDLPYLMQLVKEEQIPRLCLYHLVYAGRGKEIAASDLSMSEKRDFVAYIIEQALAMANAGVELEVLTTDHHADGIYLKQWIDQHLPERSADVEQLLIRHGGCSAGVKMANIDPQGYVYPCQFWRSSSLGKFPEKSFQAIWWNENNKLLQALRHKCDYLKGRCGQCQHNNLCGGCRIRAEAITGDLWESDPVCYLTDQEIGIGQ